MRFARDYRKDAHLKTKPQSGSLAVIFLIITLINILISLQIKTGEVQEIMGVQLEITTQPLSFLSFFIAGPIALSIIKISKKVNQEEKIAIKDLFYGFKDFSRSFIASILMDLYIVLWSLISFGILGIIKSYSYSMTYYLLEENKKMSVTEAITLSRKLMNGNKWRLFCLHLSYFGWYLLSVLTFGVLLLWVEPRVHQATFIFYKEIYEENGFGVEVIDNPIIDDKNSYSNNYSE